MTLHRNCHRVSCSRLLSLIYLLGVAFSGFECAGGQSTPPEREWTVLVYMNGKNSLEQAELDNFNSIAKVGSSDQVAIVAELGRPQRHGNSEGAWSGVYRFYIKPGTRPIPTDKAMDVATSGESTDMGSPQTLASFIEWGKHYYPAKRYILIICNHGQGWRLELASSSAAMLVRSGQTRKRSRLRNGDDKTPSGGFRAVSKDEDSGSILFNHEIEGVLMKEFGPGGLSVLGFDACFMAMTETAYEFEPSTKVLVASEDLEFFSGWDYSQWIANLIANPTASNEDIGRAIVKSYQDENRDEYLTTLSAINLAGFRKDVSGLSRLAEAILAGGPDEISNIRTARTQLKSYGASWSPPPPPRTSVDLITLLDRFEKLTRSQSLRTQSAVLRKRLCEHVIVNYASNRSANKDHNPYGSQGLAIYFPESSSVFFGDEFHRGYVKSNTDRPVEFVKNESWPELLTKVLSIN